MALYVSIQNISFDLTSLTNSIRNSDPIATSCQKRLISWKLILIPLIR